MPRVVNTAYSQYIHSPAWRKKRSERLAIDSEACTRCGTQERLEVHHLTYDRLGSERMDDLLTLCDSCHAKEHGRDPNLPGLLPAAYFAERSIQRFQMEWWQDAVAQAVIAHKALAELFEMLSVYMEAEPRATRIRKLLDDLMCEATDAQEAA